MMKEKLDSSTKKCHQCGNTLGANAAFCGKCGSKLKPMPAPQESKETISPSTPSTPPKPPKKKKNLLGLTLVMLVILVGIAIAAFFFLRTSYSKEAFIARCEKELSSGKESRMLALLKENPDFKELEEHESEAIVALLKQEDYRKSLIELLKAGNSKDFSVDVKGKKFGFFNQYALSIHKLKPKLGKQDEGIKILFQDEEIDKKFYPGIYSLTVAVENPMTNKRVDKVASVTLSQDQEDKLDTSSFFLPLDALSDYPHATLVLDGEEFSMGEEKLQQQASKIFADGSKIQLKYKTSLGELLSDEIVIDNQEAKTIVFPKAKDIREFADKTDFVVYDGDKRIDKVEALKNQDYLVGPLEKPDAIQVEKEREVATETPKIDEAKKDSETSSPAIVVASVEATSVKSPMTDASNNYYYYPNYVVDGDLSTAWCEGRSDLGIGERLTIHFTEAVDINNIYLNNGYWKSQTHWLENSRASVIRVADSNGNTRTLNLTDSMVLQQGELNFKSTNYVSIELVDVITGDGDIWKDTLISEIRFD